MALSPCQSKATINVNSGHLTGSAEQMTSIVRSLIQTRTIRKPVERRLSAPPQKINQQASLDLATVDRRQQQDYP
jgi:hypothetical protein